MPLTAPRARLTAAGALSSLILAGICHAQSDAVGTASGTAQEGVMWVAVLVGAVLVPLLLWGVRRQLRARIRQQMTVASAEAGAEPATPGQETPARSTPEFALYEADSPVPGSNTARAQREGQALSLFRRVCLVDLAAAACYAILPAAFSLSVRNKVTALGATLAVVIAIFTAIRYLMHRQQFRAFDLNRSRRRQRLYQRLAWLWRALLVLATIGSGATFSNLLYLPDILRGVFGARVRTWLSFGAAAGMAIVGTWRMIDPPAGTTRGAGIGLLLAAVVHAYLFATFGRRWRDVAGIRLLILRVFNIESTSAFLFSGLMKYWRHFGNHFTVVDPALIEQDQANSTWRTTLIVCAGWVLLMIFMVATTQWAGAPTHWPAAAALAAVPSCAVAAIAYAIGRYRIDRRFTRGRAQLTSRIDSLTRHPRHLDLTFRHARVLCHDNTWFMAVSEFARQAHVVLMDLRGYSPERKGCQREVDFLFDTVPAERVLFLIDVDTDVDVVCDLLLERWASLQWTSPNLAQEAPVIALFLSCDNDERDMQALLDHLIAIADRAQP